MLQQQTPEGWTACAGRWRGSFAHCVHGLRSHHHHGRGRETHPVGWPVNCKVRGQSMSRHPFEAWTQSSVRQRHILQQQQHQVRAAWVSRFCWEVSQGPATSSPCWVSKAGPVFLACETSSQRHARSRWLRRSWTLHPCWGQQGTTVLGEHEPSPPGDLPGEC